MGDKGVLMNIELKVSGMTCGHCETAVQKALQSIEGVNAVQVSRITGSATIEGSNVNPDKLIAAIVEEGYSASLAA
jgi:copper chaperone